MVKVTAAFNVYNGKGGGKLSLVFTTNGDDILEAQISFRKDPAKTFKCPRTSKVNYFRRML